MSLEFYRGLYDAEWARRDEVRQAAGFPAAVLTLLAGVLVLYARTYSLPRTWMAVLFGVSFTAAFITFCAAVYMLARSLFGPKYLRIPWPSQIRDYEEGLIKFYRGKPDAEALVMRDWEAELIDRYVHAADRNAENNANAGEYLYKANRAVVVTLIAVALGAIPVVDDFRANRGVPQAVEIINLESLSDVGRQRAVGRPGDDQRVAAPTDSTVEASPAVQH
jgi:hypothetical protein